MNTKKLFGTGVTAMLLAGLLAIVPAVGAEESEPADETAMGMLYEVVLATEEATYPLGEIAVDSSFEPAPREIPGVGELQFLPKGPIVIDAGVAVIIVDFNVVEPEHFFEAGIEQKTINGCTYIGPYVIVPYMGEGLYIWVGVLCDVECLIQAQPPAVKAMI